jgi:hypothetical protein
MLALYIPHLTTATAYVLNLFQHFEPFHQGLCTPYLHIHFRDTVISTGKVAVSSDRLKYHSIPDCFPKIFGKSEIAPLGVQALKNRIWSCINACD